MAETERFPEQAARYFDVLFVQVHERLSVYLKDSLGISARASAEGARKLLGQILYPRFPRALFGLDPLAVELDRESLSRDFDIKPIRVAVANILDQLQRGGSPS